MKVTLTIDAADLYKVGSKIQSMNYHVENIGSELGLQTTEVAIEQLGDGFSIRLELRRKPVDAVAATLAEVSREIAADEMHGPKDAADPLAAGHPAEGGFETAEGQKYFARAINPMDAASPSGGSGSPP